MNRSEHIVSTAGLKAGDYVKVLSNQPAYHLCSCYSGMDIRRKDIAPEEFFAIINTVIDERSCYITTVRPSGHSFIAGADELVCRINPEELSKEEREIRPLEYMQAVNQYINTQAIEGNRRDKCEEIARKAVESLFPDADIRSVQLQRRSWFRTKDIIATAEDMSRNYGNPEGMTPEKQARLEDMLKSFIKWASSCRYKQYYTIFVGIQMPEEPLPEYMKVLFPKMALDDGEESDIPETWTPTVNWVVPVAVDFSDAFVLRDIEERNRFFRSLGPEFNDLDDALTYFTRECLVDQPDE